MSVEDLWGSVLDVLRLICWFWYGGAFCTVRCARGLFLVGVFFMSCISVSALFILGAWGGSPAWTEACGCGDRRGADVRWFGGSIYLAPAVARWVAGQVRVLPVYIST